MADALSRAAASLASRGVAVIGTQTCAGAAPLAQDTAFGGPESPAQGVLQSSKARLQ